MKVLITGTEGYIGSLVAPLLMQHGHDVTGVDSGYYKEGWLYNGTAVTPKTLRKDVREIESADLQGFDAVVHMAELSNDPTGELDPRITYEINHRASVRLASLAKDAGVTRFVYMSSCSVYGIVQGDAPVTEEWPISPQTTYAVCKTLVERDLTAMADDRFSPVFLRNATAFGASPRMRFDLVLNNLCGLAWTTHEIKMTSDGTPWRPLVHVLDIGKAIALTLAAPRGVIHAQVFNVGDSQQNYRVREIAEIVAEVFPGCAISFGKASADNRSYRVGFEKIHRLLPGFQCDWNARKGAEQLLKIFQRIEFGSEQFGARPFTRLKELQYLRKTQQIDQDFFWTKF
jgi:nucleoside-diphosphate-sugar epimerase